MASHRFQLTSQRRFPPVIRDAVIIALISIAALEIGLRIFHYFRPLPIFYDSSYNRFRVRPHTPIFGFQTNSRGFFDIERTRDKAAGTYRALGIGDSFSFGVVPHEFNYLTLLENNIKLKRPRFELINMGIPGLNPREYLAILLNEGLDLKPDMVLLSFFIGNDFLETAKVDRIYRISYTANIVRYLYALGTKVGDLHWSDTSAYNDEAPTLTDDAFLQIEGAFSRLLQKEDSLFDNLLPNTVSHLRAIKQICDRYGLQLTIVIIPDALQVNSSLLQKIANVRGVKPEQFDLDRPNRALSAELTRLGIDHLDLLPAFMAATPSGGLYKPNDTHWNIRGNSLAGQLILDHVLPKLPASVAQ